MAKRCIKAYLPLFINQNNPMSIFNRNKTGNDKESKKENVLNVKYEKIMAKIRSKANTIEALLQILLLPNP
ncbi:hypothetical protein [Hyunsoonleella rubra]|uniref:Uncharacterized protein n=1 Tax=Hyunsoonleella rubra TaxID=1737062 RepID=A0ABW5TC61_9FLAO